MTDSPPRGVGWGAFDVPSIWCPGLLRAPPTGRGPSGAHLRDLPSLPINPCCGPIRHLPLANPGQPEVAHPARSRPRRVLPDETPHLANTCETQPDPGGGVAVATETTAVTTAAARFLRSDPRPLDRTGDGGSNPNGVSRIGERPLFTPPDPNAVENKVLLFKMY